MSRFRLYPSPEQEILLLDACGHARYVWNLALEQRLMWRRWQGPTPGLTEQNRQLTEARAAQPWLAAGSVTVQQQALRDHDQAWRNFYAEPTTGPPGADAAGTRGSGSWAPRRCGSGRTTGAGPAFWCPRSGG